MIAVVEKGRPSHVARVQLDHSSIRTTEQFYAHFSPGLPSPEREKPWREGKQMGGRREAATRRGQHSGKASVTPRIRTSLISEGLQENRRGGGGRIRTGE